MTDKEISVTSNVQYAHGFGTSQAISLGLRASLPVLAFLALGPLTAASGAGAPLALALGMLLWLPTTLSYLELASASAESGIYELVAHYRRGLLAFLATWVLLIADLLAASLLTRQGIELLIPWLSPLFSARISNATTFWLSLLLLLAILALTVFRRRLWRRSDDLILLGGLGAVILLVGYAFLNAGGRSIGAGLPAPAFRDIASGALLPVLALLAVEAIGEWKTELRRPERTIPRLILLAQATLLAGTMALLLAGMLLDGQELAAAGLARLTTSLPSPYLGPIISALFLVVIISAITALLLQAERLMHQLSREGYLPRLTGLAKAGLRLRLDILILAILGGAALLLPQQVALDILLAMVILYALEVNITAIMLRPHLESKLYPERFLLPFPPLIPATGLVIALFLAFNADLLIPLSGLAALAVGCLIYFAYGRAAHRKAQEARTVFRRPKRQQAEEGAPQSFRVLTPLLGTPAEQRALLQLASALAKPVGGEVLLLQIVLLTPQQSRAEGVRLARESNQLLQWSLGQTDADVTVTPLTRIGRDVVSTIIDTAREEKCDLLLLTWRPARMQEGLAANGGVSVQRSRLVSRLVQGAPCTVAALDGNLKPAVKRILVPTAGGPNAPLAARLALSLARIWNAQVVGLNILRDGDSEEAREQARNWVLKTFEGLPGADQVDVRLTASRKSIPVTLIEEANSGYDLVMLGASNEGVLDRFLFGDIPQQVAEGTEIPAIMVRASRPVQEAWARLFWDRLQHVMPQLDSEEQIDLYRNLRRGARPNVNYFVLIWLSAIIATLGLWQNSAAVIIGAMLVAPLMTPIMATSLGIVMGDARTIRVAIEATIKGVASAIAVAVFVTLILPNQIVGNEIMARTQPNALDLIVALASGAAGAYALARREVSAALPGVAIAAALMPPLCTVGIGLATFQAAIAGGAMLLFTTNLIAINVAGGLVFLLVGMRPRRDEQMRETQFRRGLVVAISLLVAISLPLTWLSLRSAEQIRNRQSVETWLTAVVDARGNATLQDFSIQREGQQLIVQAHILSADGAISEAVVESWRELLARQTKRPVRLTVDVQPVIRLEAGSP